MSVQVTCPVGCNKVVTRPFALKNEPITCENCTAVYRIPEQTLDGATVIGVLVARPGEKLSAPSTNTNTGPSTLASLSNPRALLGTAGGAALLGFLLIELLRQIPNATDLGDLWSLGPVLAVAPVAASYLAVGFLGARGGLDTGISCASVALIGAIVIDGFHAFLLAVMGAVIWGALGAVGGLLAHHRKLGGTQGSP